MNEIGLRIQSLRKTLGYTQAEFAALFGVTHAHISAIENGKNMPSEMLVKFICEKLGASRQWLETGKGDMQSEKGYLKILEREKGKIAFEVNGNHMEMVRFVSAAIIFIAEQISRENDIPYDVVEKDVIGKVIEMVKLIF